MVFVTVTDSLNCTIKKNVPSVFPNIYIQIKKMEHDT